MSTGDRDRRILSDIILGGMDAWMDEAKHRAEMSREILARHAEQEWIKANKWPIVCAHLRRMVRTQMWEIEGSRHLRDPVWSRMGAWLARHGGNLRTAILARGDL